jgi:tRNA threonylcarbamoyladenosine biosynthesis protein TsaB
MRILAFDTSTEYLSLALLLDGETLSRDLRAGQQHSELILPMTQELLAEAGVALRDLDCIAFGQGPGSFTGLRIGCGVAQGLAFGAELPVAPVSTLLALAQGSGHDSVVACLDARMGEVYHAIYQRGQQGWNTMSDAGLYSPQDVPAVEGDQWAGVGSGFSAYHEPLSARYAGQLHQIDGTRFPHAKDIATLAATMVAAGQTVAPDEAAPLYIRDKVALKTSER